MSAWNSMTESKKNGVSMFLKMEEGKSYEGIFRGEPYCYYKKYQDPTRTEYENPGEGRAFAFKMNFITVNAEGELVSQVVEGGARLRDPLLEAKDEYGLDCVFKIKKTGQGTKTNFSVLFKEKLNEDILAKINAVPLKSLKRTAASATSAGSNAGSTACPF